MPVRKGYLAPPQNSFIDNVISKYDRNSGKRFVIGNAHSEGFPIIYCNSSFCELTGYDRQEVVQKSCSCDFLHGDDTDPKACNILRSALQSGVETEVQTYYYKKNGERYLCKIILAPIKNETGDVIMYMVAHEEILPRNGTIHHMDQIAPQLKLSKMFLRNLRRSKSTTLTSTTPDIHAPNGLPHRKMSDTLSYCKKATSNNVFASSEGIALLESVKVTRPEVQPVLPSFTIVEAERNSNSSTSFESTNLSMIDLRVNSNASSSSVSLLLPQVEEEEERLSQVSPSEGSIVPDTTKKRNSCVSSSDTDTTCSSRSRLSVFSLHPSVKVTQVMSLGSDILPEYKVESPKIHPWTILHYSPFKAIWDWVVLFLVMYTAIITPYMAAFVLTETNDGGQHAEEQSNVTITDDPLVILDYIVDVMFIIDIFINFRTTFVDVQDEVVSDPCRVAIHYMKGWFLVDLLAAIPFELLIMIGNTDQTTTLIGLLKTARLLRLVRVARKLDRYSEYGTALLLLLMFGFALVAHWLACVWFAIGNCEKDHSLGWLTKLGEATNRPFNKSIPNSGPDIQTKYLTALYFTLSSLTSVGFGNISANTNGEKIFTIIIMLMGALMHAVIFGNVTAIIQRLYSGMAHYHSTMRRVREFIRFYQIPSPLRQRLEDYAQYDYSYTNGIDMNEVLRNFPEGLQADISLHLNRHLLSTNLAFRGSTPGCLRSLSLKLVTTHCPPGDYIIHYGDEITNLYWIGRGTVEIIQNDTIIAILGKGDSFGENFGLTAHRMTGKAKSSVRALTYCDLHFISKDSLIYIMCAYPEFRKSFNMDLKITYDLRDAELEEKDINSSLSHLPQASGTLSTNRTPSKAYDHVSNYASSSCWTTSTQVDSLCAEDRYTTATASRTHLDSVSKFGIEQSNNSSKRKCSRISVQNNPITVQQQLLSVQNNPITAQKRRRSVQNNPITVQQQQQQCTHLELRREIDDLRAHLYRIESAIKDDTRTIVELLQNNISTPSTTAVVTIAPSEDKHCCCRNDNSVVVNNRKASSEHHQRGGSDKSHFDTITNKTPTNVIPITIIENHDSTV